MKLGQLIEYIIRFFFKNYAENVAGRLGPKLGLFSRNAYYEVKASGLQLSFNIFQ